MPYHHPIVALSIGFFLTLGVLLFGLASEGSTTENTQRRTEQELKEVSRSLQDTRLLAEQRLIANVKPNGGFVYRYDPKTDSSPNRNNELRQLMASRLLGELAREDSSLYALHRKNLEYIFDRYYTTSGEVARIEYSNKSKLGAIAMAVRALVASPFADEYTQEILQLAETILRLQNPDGSLRAWWIAPTYAYDEDYLLTFYSGEAILALLELYRWSQDTKRLDAARRAQDFYLVRYVEQIEERYYPAYVPRHTMSLWHLWEITGERKYADAVLVLNDKLIDEILYTGSALPNYRGRFYNPQFAQYGTPHSSSDAVYTEGLAYAYVVAKDLQDDVHLAKYRDALDLATKNLMHLQYTEQNISPAYNTKKLLGAIRTNYEDQKIRTDTTQHMIDAFRAVERFVK